MSKKLTAERVKARAKELGADIVGIASIDRWEGAPKQMDPRYIMPEAKSIIVMGFRIFRGSLRGIEEGTFFSNYSSMGYGGLNYLYIPMTVINLCKMFEDEGYEAIPLGHQSDWRAIGMDGSVYQNHSRPVEPGKPAPDVMIHMRIAGFLAGLGEIGFSKLFLSPEFGPRQRLGLVMTEADLEPDPLYDGPQLCDRCMACVKDCPVDAFSKTDTVKVTLAGREVEWSNINTEDCNLGYRGAERIKPHEKGGGYLPDTDPDSAQAKRGFTTPFYRKPGSCYRVGQGICAGRGCIRACIISLEKRGVLKTKFKLPFRRRKPWRIDWSDYEG